MFCRALILFVPPIYFRLEDFFFGNRNNLKMVLVCVPWLYFSLSWSDKKLGFGLVIRVSSRRDYTVCEHVPHECVGVYLCT